jgi:hypothetical protein
MIVVLLSSREVFAMNDGSTSTERPEVTRPILMSQARHDRLRRLLPSVDSPEIQEILNDDRLILYTEEEMPKAYQDWDGGLPGVHSPDYNISANSSEPFGNGNVEFPWGSPAGTHRTQNVSTFRFLWLPTDEQGETLPVVWYRPYSSRGYSWTFPVGAVVGEVLVLRGPDDKGYTFELRVRRREYGEWAVDVFRPFPTAADLAERIAALRPYWKDDEALTKLVSHLQDPVEMKKHKLSDEHPRLTFEQSMGIDSLPSAGDDKLVAELLLETEYQSVLGVEWRRDGDGLRTFAPTTKSDFHVVPAKYDAGFVEVDRISCMRCHETVGQHVRDFEFGRDWYGRVRGSDGIFSFHPFSLGSVSYNGFGREVHMRSELIEAGILARFNSKEHSAKYYQRLEAEMN